MSPSVLVRSSNRLYSSTWTKCRMGAVL